MSFQKVLIAVDDNPIAAHAADVGAELAHALGAEVALIHVIDPALAVAPDAGIPAEELALLARREAARVIADFRVRIPAGLSVLQFTPQGPPGEEIVKAAQDWPADVIVIGSHGRGGLTRALVGSVAETVMRHSPCPVLTVRAKE